MRPERYFLRAETRYERAICNSLKLHGMSAAVPKTRRFERRKGKRAELVCGPALPSYIVLKAMPGEWAALREIDHVASRPLMRDGEVKPMTAAERAYVGNLVRRPPPDPRDPYQGEKPPDPKAPKFKVGQKVTIKDGPFFGFHGVVEAMAIVARRWRVKVEVMIFGRPTPVDLDADAVVLAA